MRRRFAVAAAVAVGLALTLAKTAIVVACWELWPFCWN